MNPTPSQGGEALLNDYFDDLLQEPELEAGHSATEEGETGASVELNGDQGSGLAACVPVDEAVAQPESTPTTVAEESTAADTVEQALEGTAQQAPLPVLNLQIPDTLSQWRETEKHDCLLLQLAGITLAMPLCCVDLPKPWPEGVELLDHAQSLFQARYPTEQQTRVVVHLAEIIMPGRGVPVREGIVVPMLNLPWSLRVDDLQGTRSFSAGDINWNQSPSKRPWLGGMVRGQPVALVDPLRLAQQLEVAWQS